MVVTALVGAAMIATARIGWRNTPSVKIKRTLEKIVAECEIGKESANGTMRLARVTKLVRKRWGYVATFLLPVGYSASKFEKHEEVFHMTTSAEVRMRRGKGRVIYMDLGMQELQENMPYRSDLSASRIAVAHEPVVPLHTPFGVREINFHDEASTHLLIGGATRTGKSVLIRLIVTHIMHRLNGDSRFVLIDHKIEDLFPFRDVVGITCAETMEEARTELLKARAEVATRRKKLKAAKDCVNIKQYREKHPSDSVQPLFVVIDEFGRFAEDDELQNLVIELAEIGGSLDVHLILASQRPDAQTVLRPRIKANLLARIAFTTADEANSNIILGSPSAAHLGGVQGRAVLLDGGLTTVQVPYISEAQTTAILERWRVSGGDSSPSPPATTTLSPAAPTKPRFLVDEEKRLGGEELGGAERSGQIDFEVPGSLPRFDPLADRGASLLGFIDQEQNTDDKPGDAETDS